VSIGARVRSFFVVVCSGYVWRLFCMQQTLGLTQSSWMLFLWLVFTSNLISQTTWLKVKLKLEEGKL